MLNLILLGFLALLLGAAGKYADLLNEHNVKPLFREPKALSGYIWGLSGIGIMLLSPYAGITYVAHVLYWFLRIKLEFFNHAIAGILILLAAFLFQGEFYQAHAFEFLAVFIGYTLTGYINSYLKKSVPMLRPFLRLRLRTYLVPLCYSFYLGMLEPFFTTVFGMLACEIITYLFRNQDAERQMQNV